MKARILKHFADPMPEGRAELSDDLFERCQSDFEKEVLRMLLEANYRVRPQVKAGAFSIDLVVKGREDRRLAIELDGDFFHGPEVWGQDMARQAALERAGWTFWRVFGSQWREQKEYWWNNLVETLGRMGIEPIGAEKVDERFTESRVVYAGPAPEDVVESAAEPDEVQPVSTTRGIEEVEPEVAELRNARASGRARGWQTRQTNDTTPDLFDASERLKESTSGRIDKPVGRIAVGSKVRVKEARTGEVKEYMLVEGEHDPNRGLLGVHAPLGSALLDGELGERVTFLVESARREVDVLEVA